MLFKIDGWRLFQSGSLTEAEDALEILFDNYLEVYAPYMMDTEIDDRKTRSILSKRGLYARIRF